MKRIIAILATILALSLTASAQREYGYGRGHSHNYDRGRHGYELDFMKATNNVHAGYGVVLTKSWDASAFVVGWSQMVPVSSYSPILLEYGADVRYSRHRRDESESTPANRNLTALDVPISLMYSIPLGTSVSLMPYVGIDLCFNLWGRYNPNDSKSVSCFSDKMVDEYGKEYNRFVLGGHAGVKLAAGPVIIGLTYQTDITRLSKETVIKDGKIKTERIKYNYAPLVTVGYIF